MCEFGGKGRGSYSKYRKFVYKGMNLDKKALTVFRRGGVLGSDSFKAWLAKNFAPGDDDAEGVSGLKAILRLDPISCKESRDRLMREFRARLPHRANHRGSMMVALYRLGYPLREIGKFYGVGPSAVSQHVRRIRLSEKEKVLMEKVMSNVKR